MRSTFTWSAKMASNPPARTMSGTSVLMATVMTAAVAIAVAAQATKVTGTRIIRAVPRCAIVARIALYSARCRSAASKTQVLLVGCRKLPQAAAGAERKRAPWWLIVSPGGGLLTSWTGRDAVTLMVVLVSVLNKPRIGGGEPLEKPATDCKNGG